MNLLGPATLVTALSAWGQREALSKKPDVVARGRGALPPEGSARLLTGVEVVLEHVPHLVARLLLSEPLADAEQGVIIAEFDPEDANALLLHCGRALAECAERILTDETQEGRLNRELTETLVSDHRLVCAGQVAADDASRFVGTYVVWDGWHRAAKWLIATRDGSTDRLSAYLIKTKHPLVQLST